MDIELTTEDPTHTETGLTEGGAYGVLRNKRIKIEAEVATDDWVVIHFDEPAETAHPAIYIPVLPGTKLRFSPAVTGEEVLIRLTEAA